MSDWIDRKAQEIRKRSEERSVSDELKLREAKLFDSLVGDFWKKLIAVFSDSIKRFNAQVPDCNRILLIDEKRPSEYFVVFQVASLNRDSLTLDPRIRRLNSKFAEFDLAVADKGIAIKKDRRVFSFDEVAERVLCDVIEFDRPKRKPPNGREGQKG